MLRQPVAEDAAALFASYTQDAEVARFMIWRPHAAFEETSAFVESCIQAWYGAARRPYVLDLRDGSASPIGMLEARSTGHTVDIGYVLARRHWGHGLMPEAVVALSDLLLADPDVFRVQATCDVDNVPSGRVLEKAGFIREGRLDRLTVHPNLGPEPRPCLMYARCR